MLYFIKIVRQIMTVHRNSVSIPTPYSVQSPNTTVKYALNLHTDKTSRNIRAQPCSQRYYLLITSVLVMSQVKCMNCRYVSCDSYSESTLDRLVIQICMQRWDPITSVIYRLDVHWQSFCWCIEQGCSEVEYTSIFMLSMLQPVTRDVKYEYKNRFSHTQIELRW